MRSLFMTSCHTSCALKHFATTVVQPIIDLVRPHTIVEVGAEGGGHTTHLVAWAEANGGTLHVVDPVVGPAVKRLARAHRHAVVLHKALSVDAIPKIERPDVMLLDGDHNWYT